MTNPPTSRDSEKTPETRTTPDFSKFNVHDSFCNPITKNAPPGGARRRLSRQQLETILASLSERDTQVITSIQRYRYLLTSQLQRLHFADAATSTAAAPARPAGTSRTQHGGLRQTGKRGRRGVSQTVCQRWHVRRRHR